MANGHVVGGSSEVAQTVGLIHHLERPDRIPEPIVAKTAGYLFTSRVPCLTQQGDCVAVIASAIGVDEALRV